MKKELIIFAIIAVVASSYLNANIVGKAATEVAIAKLRIEKATTALAQSKPLETIAINKKAAKPNEG